MNHDQRDERISCGPGSLGVAISGQVEAKGLQDTKVI